MGNLIGHSIIFPDTPDRITAYTDSIMPHTYVSGLVHCVFSTKLRRNLIKPEIQSDLWSFLGGIARKNKFKALMVGGTENHVHILLSLPAGMPLAKAMQLIKGSSSRWMNETHTKDFAWQEGYGTFTVGISQKRTRSHTSNLNRNIIANAVLRRNSQRS